MSSSQTVVSSIDFPELDSIFHISSDRQLTRAETMKVVGIYIALHGEAQTARNMEYHIKFPSRLIPDGNDFSPECFTAIQAESPRKRT